MKKIKIISIFDKHHDFIELQYKSILKHVKCDYEYIVFNNASTKEQESLNYESCEKFGIKCIRIYSPYGSLPSDIAGAALNESFNHFKDDLVFKIDSDMFFISDINLIDFFENYHISYVPILDPTKNESSMWSGIFGIDLSSIDLNLDFRPNVIPHSDTFGQSCLITANEKYNRKLFQLYNLHDVNNNLFTTNLNTNCVINLDQNGITYIEKPNYPILPQEIYISKYSEILEKMVMFDFPKPYSIDIIEVDNKDFIFHFKSSNWCPWYTPEYINLKKKSLIKLLNNT